MTPREDTASGDRWRRHLRMALLGTVALVLVAAPWWGPRLLQSLAFFQVREIVVDGVRYVPADSIARRLALRPAASVFDDLDALVPRVTAHGGVATARVERELPARLRVIVAERVPVALLPARGRGTARRLVPVDADGRVLPIDPTHAAIDVPVVADTGRAVLQALDRLQREAPRLYRRIASARALPDGGVAVVVDDVVVLAPREVPVSRWLDIFPVLEDLARRGARAREIDLRFARQVVARVATP